jgi:hypothetical protein
LAALSVSSAIVHPFGAVKSKEFAGPLLTYAQIDDRTLATLERSCQNCHSGNTAWPWYSYIAPVSWLIENDVRKGRSRMNLSRWPDYSVEEREKILSEVATVVKNGEMPLPQYTLIHPDAKLSEADVDQIYQWARGERRRLKLTAPEKVSPAANANLHFILSK